MTRVLQRLIGSFVLLLTLLLSFRMEVLVVAASRRVSSSFRGTSSCVAFAFLSSSSCRLAGSSRAAPTLLLSLDPSGRCYQRRSPRAAVVDFGGRRQERHSSSTVALYSTKPKRGGGQQQQQQPQDVKKKRKKPKKNAPGKQLYRADRVLANRSGKTRAECHKLLRKLAISILEEENEESIVDKSKLRVIQGPKEQIPMTARIFINGKFEVPSLPPLLTVYHKPKWVLSTMGKDAQQRQNLQGLTFAFSRHMHPVGRLDYDTSGLLLFSSSGLLTQTLLHPKFAKEKEYVAVVVGTVDEQKLRDKLQGGIELVDIQTRGPRRQKQQISSASEESTATSENSEEVESSSDDHESGSNGNNNDNTPKATFITRADLLEVHHWPTEDVAPYLQRMRDTLPSEYNVTDLNLRGYMDVFNAKALSEIRIVVQEGKHRMVRRMLATCGHAVVSLQRERMGVITLGDLPEGAFRNLTTSETEWAQSLLDNKNNNKKNS